MPRRAVAVLLSVALMALSGCVWLRLLELRDQLKDFDTHFAVRRPSGGLVLECRHPVVRGEDVAWIVTGPPTRRSDGPPNRWTWRFRKEPIAGDAADLRGRELDLATELDGAADDSLVTAVVFPDPLLQVVPPEVVVAMLRALGTAAIDRDQRTAMATLEKPTVPLAIPDRPQILAWFGKPHEIRAITVPVRHAVTEVVDGKPVTTRREVPTPAQLLTFRYRLVDAAGAAGEAQPLATVSFAFLDGRDRPWDFRANLGGNWVRIALPR